jgi:hypothetical protein
MYVDVAAYPGFCVFAFGVCIRFNTDAHTKRKQTEARICCHINIYIFQHFIILYIILTSDFS